MLTVLCRVLSPTVLLVTAAAAIAAGPQADRMPPRMRLSPEQMSQYRLISLSLPNGLGDGQVLTVHMGCLGGWVRNIWLTGGADQTYRGWGLPVRATREESLRDLPVRHAPAFFADASALKVSDSAVTGQLCLASAPPVVPGQEARRRQPFAGRPP